jgi:hypothetical protein
MDMYPKLKQETATTTTRILTQILYGSKMQIKMDTQMGQQKFPVKSHQMNMFHLQRQEIVMIMTQI